MPDKAIVFYTGSHWGDAQFEDFCPLFLNSHCPQFARVFYALGLFSGLNLKDSKAHVFG